MLTQATVDQIVLEVQGGAGRGSRGRSPAGVDVPRAAVGHRLTDQPGPRMAHPQPLEFSMHHLSSRAARSARLRGAVAVAVAAGLTVAPAALAQSHTAKSTGHPAKPSHRHPRPPRHKPQPKPPAPSRLQATTLVSDQGGPGVVQDPNLANGWGLSLGPNTPAWVSSQGKSLATLYDGGVGTAPVTKQPLEVSVPGVTGQVFNSTTGYPVTVNGQTAPAAFIFASVTGQILAWNPTNSATTAQTVASVPGAVFTGLALDGNRLYAADFATDKVDVFDDAFQPVAQPAGAFTDPKVPSNYDAFGVEAVPGVGIVVTYAQQDPTTHLDVHKPHAGIVDIYDANGTLLHRLDTGRTLDAPWGVTLAPKGLGTMSGQLLVANFGDGKIQAYNPKTRKFEGQLLNGSGKVLTIPGLWGIEPGTPRVGGTDTLLYAAGPGAMAEHGAFGKIAPSTATHGTGSPSAPSAPSTPTTPGY
jgi:uncharacterized protein (TIGR03118 family)